MLYLHSTTVLYMDTAKLSVAHSLCTLTRLELSNWLVLCRSLSRTACSAQNMGSFNMGEPTPPSGVVHMSCCPKAVGGRKRQTSSLPHLKMRLSSSLLLLCGFLSSTVIAQAVSCPPQPTCNGLAGIVVNALKDYSPAKAACSSRVPVPRKTCTSTAPKATLSTIVGTTTAQVTVATTTTT